MTEIWWCQEHDSEQYPVKTTPLRCFKVLVLGNFKIDTPCRMVPMRLIPDNGETVERIAKVIQMNAFAGRDYNSPLEHFFKDAQEILAALDGETP